MTPKETAWVAGLLEGEGCFSIRANKYLSVSCMMTDEDVIEKLKTIVAGGNISLRKPEANRKQVYAWNLYRREEVVSLITKLRPHMSLRRGERIDEMLLCAKENPLLRENRECGTIKSFWRGCRCNECREMGNAYRLSRKKIQRAKN